jgi:hypothetical protein
VDLCLAFDLRRVVKRLHYAYSLVAKGKSIPVH